MSIRDEIEQLKKTPPKTETPDAGPSDPPWRYSTAVLGPSIKREYHGEFLVELREPLPDAARYPRYRSSHSAPRSTVEIVATAVLQTLHDQLPLGVDAAQGWKLVRKYLDEKLL